MVLEERKSFFVKSSNREMVAGNMVSRAHMDFGGRC